MTTTDADKQHGEKYSASVKLMTSVVIRLKASGVDAKLDFPGYVIVGGRAWAHFPKRGFVEWVNNDWLKEPLRGSESHEVEAITDAIMRELNLKK